MHGDQLRGHLLAHELLGFLLEEPSSGMEDPKNWGIQCMVSIAREIRDGKLTGKIFSPVVLTGYVPDLLKSISMVSEKVELGGGGMCVKEKGIGHPGVGLALIALPPAVAGGNRAQVHGGLGIADAGL